MGTKRSEVNLNLMVIRFVDRPTDDDKKAIAILAEAYETLDPKNLVFCFNRCLKKHNKAKAKKFLIEMFGSLTDKGKEKLASLSDD